EHPMQARSAGARQKVGGRRLVRPAPNDVLEIGRHPVEIVEITISDDRERRDVTHPGDAGRRITPADDIAQTREGVDARRPGLGLRRFETTAVAMDVGDEGPERHRPGYGWCTGSAAWPG